MIKILLSLVITTLLLYIAACGFLYIFQRNFLYYPSEKLEHPFDEIQINNDNETVSVIVLNKGNDEALIYFGGNGEAVINNARNFTSVFTNKTVYLVNYRGYGGSSGKPTENGIYQDALTLYDTIKPNHNHISTMGRSLGSGAATYLAANRTINKTILITPYDSIVNVAKNKFKFFPVNLLLKDKFDSASRARNIQSEVLIIAAANDLVIPVAHTQALVDAFGDKELTFKIIKGAGHNNLSDSSEYDKAIERFLLNNN